MDDIYDPQRSRRSGTYIDPAVGIPFTRKNHGERIVRDKGIRDGEPVGRHSKRSISALL
jgi:hypothetical protein